MAQDTVKVQVTVTSVAGSSVYFDKGQNDGLVQGTIVHVFAPGGQYELEIRTSSSSSARAEMPPGISAPPVGTHGEADVQPNRQQQPTTTTQPDRPQNQQHPPWTRQEGDRDPNAPLLSPAFGQRPEERPSVLRGRAYGIIQWNKNNETGAKSDYWLERFGTSVELTNPFGQGGRAQFSGEADHRSLSVPNGADQSESNGRIDLLSYAIGTEDFASARIEGGRFYSDVLPEIGLLDGVEVLGQYTSGWRFGAGVAFYPLPYPGRDSGADYGFHLVADYHTPKLRTFSFSAGYQKTWHKGDADRDLVIARTQMNPVGPLWIFGSAKVDYYTGSDNLKSQGFQLTEGMVQARVDGSWIGVGLGTSEFRYPQLLREEYVNLPATLVQDGHNERVDGDVWLKPWQTFRVYLRANEWHDQTNSGTATEEGFTWSRFLGTDATLDAAVFGAQGSYWSGPGMRARLQDRFGVVNWSLGYQWHRYSTDGMIAGAQKFVRQSADITLDWPVGKFDFNLSGERWFGDQEDSFAVMLFTQYRF